MPQHPNDILHYYRLASQQAALAQTPEEEAAAYRQVVDFCEDSRVCRLDDSIKRNSVMFWSYNNIGDALLKKGRSLLSFKAASKIMPKFCTVMIKRCIRLVMRRRRFLR